MPDNGPDSQVATPVCPGEGTISEFVLLVAPAWQSHMSEVLAVLAAAGAEVTATNEESAIVEGKVDSGRVEILSRLAQVAALAWRRDSPIR
jgi:small neutral amino acid transporter SnatA (MarC family)